MNARSRTKLVAYAILAFLALLLGLVGGTLAYSGWSQREFLLHGNAEAIQACVQNVALDCDPRHWRVLVGVGGGLLVVAAILLARIGWRMRRLVR